LKSTLIGRLAERFAAGHLGAGGAAQASFS
jgi:hypothetical protein